MENLTAKQRALLDSLVSGAGPSSWCRIMPEETRTARSLAKRGILEISEEPDATGGVHVKACLAPGVV